MKKYLRYMRIIGIIIAVIFCSSCGTINFEDSSKDNGENELMIFAKQGENEINKYGFINKKGDIVIEPEYDFVTQFSKDGTAVVSKNKKKGCIDKDGNIIIPIKYDDMSNFACGVALVSEEKDKYKLIDKKGNIIKELEYKPVMGFTGSIVHMQFDDGLIPVCLEYADTMYGFLDIPKGYMDTKGNIKIPLQYDAVDEFNNGLAIVSKKDIEKLSGNQQNLKIEEMYPKGIIDIKGNIVVPFKYKNIIKAREGLFPVQDFNDKWGFIDEKGNVIVEPRYGMVFNFFEGLAGVKIDGKWGFIDKTGNLIVEPKYESIWTFSDGLAGVKIDGKWGSIDKTGKIRIEPKYEYLYSFENGVAMVDQHHKIINKEDKTIFESESGVFRIYRLDEGMLYIVTNEGNTIIIDKYGNEISKKPST